MAELVRTDRLTRRYVMGDNVLSALDGVTLTFEQGEVAVIVGRSGSGKSTLLQLLGGLDRPSGEVYVRGNGRQQRTIALTGGWTWASSSSSSISSPR